MQMINSLMKYTKIGRALGTSLFNIADYTEVNLKTILALDESTSDSYIDTYMLSDDETIEGISYRLYGSEKYWDLLLILNSKDPLFDMCYSVDSLKEESFLKVQEYENTVYGAPLPTERFLELQKEIFTNLYIKNENNRLLKIIKVGMLSDYIKVLRKAGFNI